MGFTTTKLLFKGDLVLIVTLIYRKNVHKNGGVPKYTTLFWLYLFVLLYFRGSKVCFDNLGKL